MLANKTKGEIKMGNALQVAISAELAPQLEKRGIDEFAWNTLTNSIFPGALEESILMACDYCTARSLDILKKPVHIVPMSVQQKIKKSNGGFDTNKVWRDVIMPGIYEARITADRTGKYAGQDEPVFGEMVEIENGKQTTIKAPEFCKVTVYKIVANQKVAFSHTEYFEEAVARKNDGGINSMWLKRKRGQLAKCAEAGALRKAFPEQLGGEMTADEMAGHEIDMGTVDRVDTDSEDFTPKAKTEAAPAEVTPHKETAGAEVVAEEKEPVTIDQAAEDNSPKINDNQIKLVSAKLDNSGIGQTDFFKQFSISDFGDLQLSKINEALTWISDNGA